MLLSDSPTPMSAMKCCSGGTWRHADWDDGWTVVTADGLRTAQFEHTILVGRDGAEILTRTSA